MAHIQQLHVQQEEINALIKLFKLLQKFWNQLISARFFITPLLHSALPQHAGKVMKLHVGCPRNSVETEFRLFFLLPSVPRRLFIPALQ